MASGLIGYGCFLTANVIIKLSGIGSENAHYFLNKYNISSFVSSKSCIY